MANKKSRKKAAAKSGLSTGVWVAIFAGVVLAMGLAGGVLGWAFTRGGGDTASAEPKPPSFASDPTAPRGSVEAYQFAIDNPDILAQIPCYCGCGQESGALHESNLDCYIASRNGNDIVFDKHAAG